ncbi:uncharacterized protein BT62DRAFT_1077416 [Guyanagaster necrorhizus]|uniref:Uncharacterized protein n=1 Tax=Guyanagaster necrorhizus TaxID=856835 RepID=A0A9P7VNU9_9AGAR|nr:uncharacterized protein BT62DRAFT_1077416 [Guyanagaster necrorhizus MCA 3950]KAG7444628.1 hypothetical protein BT62DRAFT_1077416 [Guyanagaster necrorhizus MCA 3950]
MEIHTQLWKNVCKSGYLHVEPTPQPVLYHKSIICLASSTKIDNWRETLIPPKAEGSQLIMGAQLGESVRSAVGASILSFPLLLGRPKSRGRILGHRPELFYGGDWPRTQLRSRQFLTVLWKIRSWPPRIRTSGDLNSNIAVKFLTHPLRDKQRKAHKSPSPFPVEIFVVVVFFYNQECALSTLGTDV